MSLHPLDAAWGRWRLGELLRDKSNCQYSSGLMNEENQHGDWKQVSNKGPKSKGKHATVPFKKSGKAKNKRGPRLNRSKSNNSAASDAGSLRREGAEDTRTRAKELQTKALDGFRIFLIGEKNRMQRSSSSTSRDFVAPPESLSLAQEAVDAFAYLQEHKKAEEEYQEVAKTQEEKWRRLSQRIERRKEWDLVEEAR